jgi:hypothetical protein
MKFTREKVFPKVSHRSWNESVTTVDEFRHWAFIAMLTKGGFGKDSQPPEWNDLGELQEFDITVSIQGVEVSYLDLIDRICEGSQKQEEDLEKLVEERAKEMMKTRYQNALYAIENMMNTVEKEEIENIREEDRNENV